MLQITIDASELTATLTSLTDRLSKIPNNQTVTTEKREIPDISRSRPRVLVPKAWQEFYADVPTQPDNDAVNSYIDVLMG